MTTLEALEHLIVKKEIAFGRLRMTVANKNSVELAERLSQVPDCDQIEICIFDAPFRHVGAWTRNPEVDGFPSVMPVWTTVGAILEARSL